MIVCRICKKNMHSVSLAERHERLIEPGREGTAALWKSCKDSQLAGHSLKPQLHAAGAVRVS